MPVLSTPSSSPPVMPISISSQIYQQIRTASHHICFEGRIDHLRKSRQREEDGIGNSISTTIAAQHRGARGRLTPMFIEAESLTKMLIFEQDSAGPHFMGGNLRKNVAKDLISGQNVRFRPNVWQTFGQPPPRKNVCLEAARFFALQTPVVNTHPCAVNTEHNENKTSSGQP